MVIERRFSGSRRVFKLKKMAFTAHWLSNFISLMQPL
jgi:hypothetical protein